MTAVTPWPLARWLAAAGPDAPGPAEVAAGAGVASSGGLALKLGALLASGTFLTGAAIHLQAPSPHRGEARAARTAHGRPAVARARPATVASVGAPLFAVAGSTTQSRAVTAPGGGASGLGRAGAAQQIARHRRHGEASAGTVVRSEGSRVGGHDDSRGDRNDDGKPSGRGGHDDGGSATSRPISGSDTHSGGQARGSGNGSGGDGGQRSDSSGAGSGSDDGATQMISDSQSLDSGVAGADSRDGSNSGSGSLDGSTVSSGSGSTVPSGSDGGSATSGQSDSESGSGSSDGGGTSGG
jgi:hypothetical protein